MITGSCYAVGGREKRERERERERKTEKEKERERDKCLNFSHVTFSFQEHCSAAERKRGRRGRVWGSLLLKSHCFELDSWSICISRFEERKMEG